MPSNASAASAAWPPYPARCTVTPSIWAISRIWSAAAGMSFQPLAPKLKVSDVTATSPSSEKPPKPASAACSGVSTVPSTTPSISPISAACSSIAARSSSVRPPSRL